MRKRTRNFFYSPIGKLTTRSGLILFIYILLKVFSGGFNTETYRLGIDLTICLLGIFVWLFFFSQFTLPIRNLEGRYRAFSSLVSYLTGSHGPTIFIEDGEIRPELSKNGSGSGRTKPKGPGVIILDSASAGMLRTNVKFTRAIGPGAVFTRANEYLAGTIDLYPQKQTIGPHESEDPFPPRYDNEELAAFEARSRRYFETRAFTRDGIEVVPNITVYFKLDSEKGEGFTRFGYNRDAVEKAIIGQPVLTKKSTSDSDKEWLKIPAYLAADVWRELIEEYTLSELYKANDDNELAIPTIQKEILKRLTSGGNDETDKLGQLNELTVLQKRGIKVLDVHLSNIRFPGEIEEKINSGWKANWLTQANKNKDYIERRRSLAADKGRNSAVYRFVNAVIQQSGFHNKKMAYSGNHILKQMLTGLKSLYSHNPKLRSEIEDELNQVNVILEWVEKETE